jgi:hypothetical protein
LEENDKPKTTWDLLRTNVWRGFDAEVWRPLVGPTTEEEVKREQESGKKPNMGPNSMRNLREPLKKPKKMVMD